MYIGETKGGYHQHHWCYVGVFIYGGLGRQQDLPYSLTALPSGQEAPALLTPNAETMLGNGAFDRNNKVVKNA